MDTDPKQYVTRESAPGTIPEGRLFSTPNETGPFQLEPKIPSYTGRSVNGHITLDDFAPEWDHDTDTLASFLAWKSAQHHTESSNNTITSLLEPICQFVRNEIRYQLKNHSTTLQREMKNHQMETQKQICQLTATIANLAEQVKVLSSRPVPTATATIVKTVTNSPPRQVPKLKWKFEGPATTAVQTALSTVNHPSMPKGWEIKRETKNCANRW